MVHVKLFGRLFAVDLASPATPAKTWLRNRWVNDTLTNEQVLFDPAATALVPGNVRDLRGTRRISAA